MRQALLQLKNHNKIISHRETLLSNLNNLYALLLIKAAWQGENT
jgi:hypothetical protein